jgi:hypothetical protein
MMTNERAREVLLEQINRYGQEYDLEGIEALAKALSALERMEHYEDDMKKAYDCGYNCAISRIVD